MQAQGWFGFVPLGVQGVTTLSMELAGGFRALSLNINTAVLAAPPGSTFLRKPNLGEKNCRHLKTQNAFRLIMVM